MRRRIQKISTGSHVVAIPYDIIRDFKLKKGMDLDWQIKDDHFEVRIVKE